MTDEIRLSLDAPPSTNHIYRHSKGKVYLSEAGRVYKEYAALTAAGQGAIVLEGALSVTLMFYNSRMDADNSQKVLLDALQGVAYLNDAQITELHIYRRKSGDDDKYVDGIIRKADDG